MPKAPTSPARKAQQLARSAARLAAVQALYQIELTGNDWRRVVREFDQHRLGAEIEGVQYREADPGHFKEIVEGVVTNQVDIDHLTDRALVERWPLGRIDSTLRAVFRAAGQEISSRQDIPIKVIIGEYVDVAKAFFEEGKEAKFVNAVLDHMAREVRPEAFG
ncbi:MAG: transcription antitermination factor NusB [Pseudomonadota bacterium]